MGPISKIFISAFIIINFLSMLRVHLPLENKLFASIYRPVDRYLSFFSIYQDWLMFAPNPSRTNLFVTAIVEFSDGSTDTFGFDYHNDLPLMEKYTNGERYRKFLSEGVSKESNKWMWPDIAKFSLRKVSTRNIGKRPVRVRLSRHWDEIPPLRQEFRPHGEELSRYKKFSFYTYEVI